MDIKVLHLIEGAKEAKGVTVMIDVFRAFTVEAYIMNGGAEKIIPIGDLDFTFLLLISSLLPQIKFDTGFLGSNK